MRLLGKALTFDDVLLKPGLSDILPSEADVRSRLTRAIPLNIPIIAMVDTNCDPEPISLVIPANDDAIRAVRLIAGQAAEAVIEGRGVAGEAVPSNIDELEAAMTATAFAEPAV